MTPARGSLLGIESLDSAEIMKILKFARRMNPDKQQAKELFAKAFSLDPTFKPTWGR